MITLRKYFLYIYIHLCIHVPWEIRNFSLKNYDKLVQISGKRHREEASK